MLTILRRNFRILAALLLITFLLHRVALAQGGATAQLSGVITDPSGAVVAGAVVTVRNLQTGLARTTESSAEGRYLLSGLPPGDYEVSAEAPGFGRLRQTGVQLTIGESATLHLSLNISTLNQEIAVTAAETSVTEPGRTEQSQMIQSRQIDNLPINGRQFLDFALLTPNVGGGRSNIGDSFRPGEPNQIDISFAGLEEIASLITVDGADNTNRVFGRSRSTPSQEAVREFRVVEHSYGAESGPAATAVINIVTKSGTNTTHGSAYYYARNDGLDARNLLASPGFDELRQNQLGGTLGGPVIRDRFFLFGNYEGQRRTESPFYSSVLLTNLSAINAVKQAIGLPPEILTGKDRKSDYDSLMLRSDHQWAARQQLALSYRFRDDRDTNLGASTGQVSAPSNFRNAAIQDHALVGNWSSVFSPNFLSQGLFQFAFRRFDWTSASFEPHLQIPNIMDMGRHVNAVDATRETRFEGGDTLSYLRGSHQIKSGGDVYHLRENFVADTADPGLAIFPNLDAFLGKPPFPPFPFAVVFQFVTGPDGSRPPAPRGFTKSANLPAFDALTRYLSGLTHYGFFATDQWRAAPNLTINFGLRWDADNRPAEFYDSYYKAFQPRAGIAYSFLSDRFVWRASGGIYQGVKDAVAYQFAKNLGQDPAFGPPVPGYSTVTGGLRGPTVSDPSVAAPAFLQFAASGIYPSAAPAQPFPTFFLTTGKASPRGLYTYQWSTQLEHRLSNELSISAVYLGVRGLNLGGGTHRNVAPAVLQLPDGRNDYAIAPGVPVTRVLNPSVAPLSLFFDDVGQSTYQAGTLTVTKRYSGHYAFSGNYTWSKSIDDSGSIALTDVPQDVYQRRLERALSKQHVPHRFVADLTAEGPERTWLKDFRFSLVSKVAAAPFYTVYAGYDVNHDGNPLSDRVGRLGRSTLKGDNYVNADVRISRRLRFSEKTHAEVIAEAFNLFNNLNVIEVNSVYGAPDLIGREPKSFKQPVAAPLPGFNSIRAIAPPRQIQFAVRFLF